MAVLRILVYGLVLGFFYLLLRIVLKGLALPRNPESDDHFRPGSSSCLPHYWARGNMLDIPGRYRQWREQQEPEDIRPGYGFTATALSMLWAAFLCFVYFQLNLPKSFFWSASGILTIFFLLILLLARKERRGK